MKKDWKKKYTGKGGLMLLALVPILWYVVFCYVPMYGVQIAFKKYNPSLGIIGSPWVGLKYFRQFFESYYFSEITLNTVILSLFTLVIGFPLPIILALIVNEIRSPFLKKSVQNITYIPHFLSVVVIVSMLNIFSNPTYGFFNDIRQFFGFSPTPIFTRLKFWVPECRIMFLIPLCPPALPFFRMRISPGFRLISSKRTISSSSGSALK